MPDDLVDIIRRLSPESLRLYKQRLPQTLREMSPQDRTSVLTKLKSIPGFEDITGVRPPQPIRSLGQMNEARMWQGQKPFMPQPPSVNIAANPPPSGVNIPQFVKQIPRPEMAYHPTTAAIWNPEAAARVQPNPEIWQPVRPGYTAVNKLGAGIGESPVGQLPIKALAAAMEAVMKVPGLAQTLADIEKKSPGLIEAGMNVPFMAPTGLGAAVQQGAMLAKPALRLAVPKVAQPLKELAASEAGFAKLPKKVPPQGAGKEVTAQAKPTVSATAPMPQGETQKFTEAELWAEGARKANAARAAARARVKPVEAVAPAVEAKAAVTPQSVQAPVAEPVTVPKVAGVPPTQPPTGAIPGKGFNLPEDPQAKMLKLIREFKGKPAKVEELRHIERQRRIAPAAAMIEKRRGEEALNAALGQLKGEMPKGIFSPIEGQFNQVEKDILFNQIWDSALSPYDKIATGRALREKVFKGILPANKELILLEKVYGPRLIIELLAKRPFLTKATEEVVGALNLPRAIQTSYDLGGTLRQSVVLAARHPQKVPGWIGTTTRSIFDGKYADDIMRSIETSPNIEKITQDMGVEFTSWQGVATRLAQREEAFMSRFVNMIPGVKHSARGFTVGLNKIRFDSANYFITRYGNKLSANDLKALGRQINIFSGRAPMPAIAELAPALNTIFYSLRLQISRVLTPTTVFSSSRIAQKEAARALVQFVGGVSTIVALAKLAGAEAELDPRSTDFGKIKVGNTRIDPWGGFQQYGVFVTRLLTEERKTAAGNIIAAPRPETIERFWTGKEAPFAGFVTDVIRGQTMLGEEMTVSTRNALQQAYNRMAPMFASDVIDAALADGLIGIPLSAPGAVGVGVQTYPVIDPLKVLGKKYFPNKPQGEEFSPAEVAKIKQTPEWENYVKEGKLPETPYWKGIVSGAGMAKEQKVTEERNLKDYKDQLARDEMVTTGKISMKQWRDGVREAEIRRAERRLITERELDYKVRNPKTPEDKALSDYYNLVKQFEGPVFDFEGYSEARDSYMASLSPQLAGYLEENLNPRATPLVQELKDAQKVLRPYWRIGDEEWAKHPGLKQENQRLVIKSQGDSRKERQLIYASPYATKILQARDKIASRKKQMLYLYPKIKEALKKFY